MFSNRGIDHARRWAVALAALVGSSGCATLVQNRYSVFGFDALETGSPERARATSLALLAGVAVVSAALGALASWLVQRRLRRRAESRPAAVAEPVPTRDTRPERTEAVA